MSATRRSGAIPMFHFAALAAALTLAPLTAFAQSPAPAPPATSMSRHVKGGGAPDSTEMNEHMKKMADRLKLTDAQSAKVRAIMQERWATGSELRAKSRAQADTPENKAATDKAREDLNADTESKLSAVLNADQMTEYKKMRAEHMKKWSKERTEQK